MVKFRYQVQAKNLLLRGARFCSTSSGGQCGQLERASVESKSENKKSVAELGLMTTRLLPMTVVGIVMYLEFVSIHLNFGSRKY